MYTNLYLQVYKSIISWAKYDLKNRIQYLPILIKHLRIALIPFSFFLNYIINEDILQLNCRGITIEQLFLFIYIQILLHNIILIKVYYTKRKHCIFVKVMNPSLSLKLSTTENECTVKR